MGRRGRRSIARSARLGDGFVEAGTDRASLSRAGARSVDVHGPSHARSGSSSPPAEPGSPRSRPVCRRGAAPVGFPGCAARRWLCWPGSASTTTPDSNAAVSTVPPTRSWTRSPAPCSSTRPNAPTWTIWRVPRRPVRAAVVALPARMGIRPELQRILDAMTEAPAYLRNGRRDLLAANRLGRSPLQRDVRHRGPSGQRRPLRVPRSTRPQLLPRLDHRGAATWSPRSLSKPAGARTTAPSPTSSASCRPAATSSPPSGLPGTSDSTAAVSRSVHHPVVGDLHLSFEALDLPADPGLSLVVYSAQPGSASDDGLRLLASWSADLSEQAGASDAEPVRVDGPDQ